MLKDGTPQLRTSRRSFAVASSATLASIGLVPGRAPAAQYQIKCGTVLTVDHPVNVGITQMWRAVEKESGGRVECKIFANSILGGEASMAEQTRAGALEFYMGPPGAISSLVPVADITYLGFAYKDQAEAMRVFEGPVGDYVRTQVAAKGIVLQNTFWDAGMQQMAVGASWHPIRNVDDMKGFKLRVPPSAILVGLMKEVGATAVALNVSETYTSLQTKLIDGIASQMATIQSFRFYEVTKYLCLTSHVWGSFFNITSANYWKSLPPDIQGIIERNNRKYARLSTHNMQILNATFRDKLGREGLAVNAVDRDSFKEKIKPYYAFWAGQFGPTLWGLLSTAIGQKLA